MAKIQIDNLKVSTIIGTKASEREEKQKLNISIKLEYDSKDAIENDDISKAVDYEALTNEIKKYVESSNFKLLETLCNSILTIILSDTLIKRATVKINKPSAIPGADSVIVELSSYRS